MKRIILCVVACCLSLSALMAQHVEWDVKLTVQDGISGTLKREIEKTTSSLLTEINRAFTENRSLQTAGLNLSAQAVEGLTALWENVHFYCDDQEVVQSVLQTKTGYQVRQIPLMLRPDDKKSLNDDDYQEAVLNFDHSGKITRFNLTIDTNIYQDIMRRGKTVEEAERRHQIVSYVEHFRTAYNEKDIHFLDQVFSDDALIITGTVIKARKTDGAGITYNKVSYRKQSKQEYLARLKRSFAVNKYIQVKFDDVRVVKHPTKEGFYGVTVHQLYANSSGYSDDGYLFLLWDFRNADRVQIHVRTWQPRYLNDAKTEELPKDEIFTAGDFSIDL